MTAFLLAVYFVVSALVPTAVDIKYLSDRLEAKDVTRWANNLIIYIYAILIIDIVICGTLNFQLWFLIILPVHFGVTVGLLFSRDRLWRFAGKFMS